MENHQKYKILTSFHWKVYFLSESIKFSIFESLIRFNLKTLILWGKRSLRVSHSWKSLGGRNGNFAKKFTDKWKYYENNWKLPIFDIILRNNWKCSLSYQKSSKFTENSHSCQKLSKSPLTQISRSKHLSDSWRPYFSRDSQFRTLGDEMGILLKNSQTNGNTMKITNFCYYLMWYCWQLSFYNGLTTTFSKKVSTIK